MKAKMKTAYLIRTGTMVNADVRANVSTKLRSRKGVARALKAARRMGFKDAYAAKMMVRADAPLKD